mmetsp:Transcript_9417/g.11721  ORF Transcript_9417/g.11721 Transcript_9417/m.11721 type:complete len:397 (-) Transcript_9417:610-1800(-)|eukprot:CAMPEP_0204839938 /NCGR_PEP_ID=MMETSP1346-20131115/35820_1 /ASSEMBLY_ACC=CAM_ASM_000771 /TAXON_ID=215587 /ORGANISM="Aplanochytrium stocchinoi, Strain GSBS06" /LENGTH=396 /DNA_ID=CAMNT_0051977007 /DNA_START=101 /DNA_END=1291 /DNA_ORIENTATION=-
MKGYFNLILALGAFASAHAEVYFKETFSDASWEDRWVSSSWKESMGEWKLTSGNWPADKDIEQGIETSQDAKFYGISSKLDKPFSNRDQDLVVQFSVKNEKKESSFCAGGYIKLLPSDTDQEKFGGDTPYFIMFGPDLCGYDVSRIHLIFNYKGDNLLKNSDIKLEYGDKDEFTHLYTLVVKPDNTYTVYFDLEEKASGSLPEEWDFPAKTIDDPDDKKPEDWVDEEMIADPDDVKPEGWDDIPEMIPDPDAEKPEDWDDEDDGEWEAPMIDNPEYKGEWEQKMIKNPDYKGEWSPAQLDNPEYDPNVYAFDDIGAVGFELWVVNSGSIFDNIFVGNSLEEAKEFAKETFSVTKEGEKAAKEKFDETKKAEDEAEAEEEAEAEAEEADEVVEEKEL